MNYILESLCIVLLTLLCWKRGYDLYLDAQQSLNRYPATNATDSPKIKFTSAWADSETKAAHIKSDSLDNVFYFLHISDIHVSKFAKQGGAAHLHTFLRHTLPFFDPPFVAVTGDLTDAKSAFKLASHQNEQEWVKYYGTLEEFGVLEREKSARGQQSRFWLDLRGNHDTFDVGGWGSAENFYKNYSVSQRKNLQYVHDAGFGSYNFVIIDGCPDIGPGRPFNFFSVVEAKDMDFLVNALQDSAAFNHSIVLSHYPISDTMFGKTSRAPYYSVDDVASGISLWLCGHYHTLVLGLGRTLMAYHNQLNVLDLEIGDTKLHALYRVMAFDNDFMSFRDLRQPLPAKPVSAADIAKNASFLHKGHEAPVVLITYPKNTRFLMPKHEPLSRLTASKHIRFFVWSNRVLKPSEIALQIDGKNVSTKNCRYIGRGKPAESLRTEHYGSVNEYLPMYILPFKPSTYDDGNDHSLQITVTDSATNLADTHAIVFKFNKERSALNAGAGEVIMSTHMERFVKDMFLFVYFSIVLGMIILPRLFYLFLRGNKLWLRYRASTSQRLIRQDEKTLRYSIFGRAKKRTESSSGRDSPINKVYPVFASFLTISGLQRSIVFTISDLTWFVEATVFRFTHLASRAGLWYPLFAYSIYITAGPFFWGHLVHSLSVTDGTWNIWSVWSKLQSFYIYGVRLGLVSEPFSPSFSYQWIPLLDCWLFAFFEVTYCLGYLALYLAFVVTPTTLLYAHVNERKQRPVHRTLTIRLLVASCVLYQIVTVIVMGFFYGWVTVLFSPGKTLFCLWGVVVLKRYLFDLRLDMEGIYIGRVEQKP